MYGAEFWKKVAKKEAICLLDVPYHPQTDDVSCGPACLKMIYDFYKINSRIFPGPTHNGTPGKLMIECIKQSGLNPGISPHRVSDRDLKDVLRLIDDGNPVIMAFADRSTETGSHYALLVGYSSKELFFHDPFLRPYFPRPRRSFREKWLKEGRWYLGASRPTDPKAAVRLFNDAEAVLKGPAPSSSPGCGDWEKGNNPTP